MNILLIGDTSNRHNWGCRATSFQLRSLLQEAGTLTGSVDTSFLTDPVEPHLSFSRREQLSRRPANRSGLRSAMFDSVSPLLFRARPELIARFKRMVDLMGPDDLNPMADAIAEARIFPHIAAAIADELGDDVLGQLESLLKSAEPNTVRGDRLITSAAVDQKAQGGERRSA